MNRALFVSFFLSASLSVASKDRTGEVQEIAPGVYFHQGDIEKGHCNQGWVMFENFVLVIDGNYPSGAEIVVSKIRAVTDKPIRFAFDTHHHGDHMYGNKVWMDAGAIPVAHEGVIEEAERYEPERWNGQTREDVASSELVLPILRFPDKLVFDDGTRRVELLHLGVSHTHGDGWAWLPEERILFSGDAAVNGPHNFVGDGDTRAWPATLEKAQALRPRIVGVGHGPLGDGSVLEDQKSFFETLHRVVSEERRVGRSAADLQGRIESLRAQVVSNERIACYVGPSFAAQIEKVWIEQGGEAFEASPLEMHRLEHKAHHVGR